MVEPGDTVKVKTEEGAKEKRFSHFKKKNQGRNANAAAKWADRDVPELLKGVEFSMDRNGPDLYIKAVENCSCMPLQHTRMGWTYMLESPHKGCFTVFIKLFLTLTILFKLYFCTYFYLILYIVIFFQYLKMICVS